MSCLLQSAIQKPKTKRQINKMITMVTGVQSIPKPIIDPEMDKIIVPTVKSNTKYITPTITPKNPATAKHGPPYFKFILQRANANSGIPIPPITTIPAPSSLIFRFF
jgi:hypothetical protein